MNKLIASLEAINIGGFIAGISLGDLYSLMGIISFGISIISGIIVIILQIKKALSDGKITDEEIEEIKSSMEDLERKVKENGKSK